MPGTSMYDEMVLPDQDFGQAILEVVAENWKTQKKHEKFKSELNNYLRITEFSIWNQILR